MLFMLFFRILPSLLFLSFPWLRTKYGANMINIIRSTKKKMLFFIFFSIMTLPESMRQASEGDNWLQKCLPA